MRVLFLLLTSVLLTACDQDSAANTQSATVVEPQSLAHQSELKSAQHLEQPSAYASQVALIKQPDPALATVSGQAVLKSQVDQTIALALFDLEWAAYELRTAALAEWLDKQQAQSSSTLDVVVQMKPPMPPRIDLPAATQQSRLGAQDAPIQISVFCNYQSSHCVRMQSVYRALREQYQAQLAFVFYELPLRFHRNALGASVAAHCSYQQNTFEVFHEALWAASDKLDAQTYLLTAKQVGMDLEQYQHCLDAPSSQQSVKATIQLADALGFKNVPVTLVNGLYVNGPKSINVFRYMIDQELARLDLSPRTIVASDQTSLHETQLPLRLEGVTLTQVPGEGSALIQQRESGDTQAYRVGSQVLEDVAILRIFEDHAVLNNAGTLERLSLASSLAERMEQVHAQDDQVITAIEQAAMASGNVLDSDEMPPADLEYQYRGVVAPDGEKPLSRAWIDEQLQNQEALRAHFQPAELEVEGVRIMRLENINDNEFYGTLGLQENDVIMRVNGEWLHEQQNTLFSSLEAGDEMSLVLMRKGLPVHYSYRVN